MRVTILIDKSVELRRLALLQRKAQAYIVSGMKAANHSRVRRALRLLALATERRSAVGRQNDR
jgi:hypothetical protein